VKSVVLEKTGIVDEDVKKQASKRVRNLKKSQLEWDEDK